MKSLKQTIINVFSTKKVGLFLSVMTAIVLTMILSSRYYLHHSIIESNVSKRDVFANKTIKIVDVEKTQKLKTFVKNHGILHIALLLDIAIITVSLTVKNNRRNIRVL